MAIDEETLVQTQCAEDLVLSMPADNTTLSSIINDEFYNETDFEVQYDTVKEPVVDGVVLVVCNEVPH